MKPRFEKRFANGHWIVFDMWEYRVEDFFGLEREAKVAAEWLNAYV